MYTVHCTQPVLELLLRRTSFLEKSSSCNFQINYAGNDFIIVYYEWICVA